MKIEVVTQGDWSVRKFAGIVYDGFYYTKSDARMSSDRAIKTAYSLALKAIKDRASFLDEAPLKQYVDNEGGLVYHHVLKLS